jgi:hypothetical protein
LDNRIPQLQKVTMSSPDPSYDSFAFDPDDDHMFPDKHLEDLSTTLAAFKKDFQFARRWAIWVQGYVEKKDGRGIPGLSVGVFLVAGPGIKKMMCARISLVDLC